MNIELGFGGGPGVCKLDWGFGPNYHCTHLRAAQQPGQRHLGHRCLMALCDWTHCINDSKGTRLVNHRKVKAWAACALWALTVNTELYTEQPPRQRAPDHEAKLLVRQQRQYFALQVAPGHGVVGLYALKAGPVILL